MGLPGRWRIPFDEYHVYRSNKQVRPIVGNRRICKKRAIGGRHEFQIHLGKLELQQLGYGKPLYTRTAVLVSQLPRQTSLRPHVGLPLEPTASLYHTQNALEPLHAQFDYLKNTVSVCNDYLSSFSKYKVTAQVYDINSKKAYEKTQTTDIPADGVVNDLFKIEFPA